MFARTFALLAVLAVLAFPLAAQDGPAKLIVAGSASFSSIGGEFVGEDAGRITSVSVAPTVLLNVRGRAYFGGSLGVASTSQDGASDTDLTVGPALWLFASDNLFISGSAAYSPGEDATSLEWELGGGALVPLAGGAFVLAQAGYAIGSTNEDGEKTGSNAINVRFGLAAKF